MREIIIGKNQCGQRLDKFLLKYLKEAPKSFIYKMLRKKNIKLNGKRAKGSEKLIEGDQVIFYLSDETLDKFSDSRKKEHKMQTGAGDVQLDIVYENEHIALINKPAGMLSQKAEAGDMSLVEYFAEYCGNTEEGFSPGICNRLDRNTSGLVIAGKTLAGLQKMSELIHKRSIDKYYITIVKGNMENGAVAEGYLKKDSRANKVSISQVPSDAASYIKTEYEPLYSDGAYTLLKVRLYTGKPHQIRSHLSSLSHPVVGDAKYGGAVRGSSIRRQLLHAYELRFPKLEHPFDDLSEESFRAELPKDFFRDEFTRNLLRNVKLNEL